MSNKRNHFHNANFVNANMRSLKTDICGAIEDATGDKWRNECRETREERNLKRNVAKEEMMIGTWRLLRQCGKMEVLVQEMDQINWNVLGISEMRWKGISKGKTEDEHRIWYSGNEKKSVHRVGFLVNMNIWTSVMEFSPVNERIAAIRIAGKPFNLTTIQVYTPTSDCCDEKIEDIYDDLEKLLKTVPMERHYREVWTGRD